MSTMKKDVSARILVDLVNSNDIKQVEATLSSGDLSSWRDIIQFEFPLENLHKTILKNNNLIPKLISCEISSISSFHLAAILGHVEIIVTILDRDVPVDFALASGTSALQLACFAGKLETVKILVNIYAAQLNVQDCYGWTALHYACIEGHYAVVGFLLEHGADISVRDKDGTSACYRAMINNHPDVVELLTLPTWGHDTSELMDIVLDGSLVCKDTTERTKPALGERKLSVPALGTTELKGTLLDQVVPLHQSTSRQTSEPTHHTLQSSGKKTTSKVARSMTLPSRRNNSSHIVRRLVRDEIENAMSEYMAPASGGEPDDEDNALSPFQGSGVGMNTLKGIMREELDKYRKKMLNDTTYENASIPQVPPPNPPLCPPPVPSSKSLLNLPKNQPGSYKYVSNSEHLDICDDNDDPYETLSTYSKLPEVTIPEDAPPLPPRNTPDGITDSVRLTNGDSSQAVHAAVLKLGPLVRTNWKQLALALPLECTDALTQKRIQDIEMAYPDDSKKQANMALTEWRIKAGNSADIDHLIIALRKCRMHDVISEVEKVTQEFTA